ncbi:MAG: coenzyme F420-0:L-glutamate ligase [Candidatus Heimdallarchaeota archaeon]|nr:coenzyme F420-0:L-glutamate ligase [Candidatus Heimdallarchaeota archaeon]
MKIEFFGIKTPLIDNPDSKFIHIFQDNLFKANLNLLDGDIVIVASKLISILEKCQISLDDIKNIRDEAKKTAVTSNLDPKFVEIVYREADEVLGAVPGAVLTLKNGTLHANSGVDSSNSGGKNYLITLPKDPFGTAERIRREIFIKTKKKVGVIIADSKTQPLRRGTSGFALGVAGFIPVIDDRGKLDLYGRKMVVTTRAIADNLVCAAEILMGETDQKIPIVIARGCLDIIFENFSDPTAVDRLMKMDPEHCIYIGPLWVNKR